MQNGEFSVELEGKRILVTGGTGSLGQAIVRRLLSGEMGRPAKVVVFSRDEAKQHYMRLSYLHRRAATDEVIYRNFQELLSFRIGDVRQYPSVLQAVREADVIVNAAALKQVPTCEYFPFEAVQTNIVGPHNVVRAIRENSTPVGLVVGISTDKACKPINVMGMTKALQERIFVEANIGSPAARFVCVRYGNVIASRGSVVPLFLDQVASGGPLTVTTKDMTRSLLSLYRAVDTAFAAIRGALPGRAVICDGFCMKVVTLFGTRPEIIRLSQVVTQLDQHCEQVLVHTGQNYDPNLSDIFFRELQLRQPDAHLGIQSTVFGE